MDEGTGAADQARLAALEREMSERIERGHWSVVSVFDPEGRTPGFSYTVGVSWAPGAPEFIVFSLAPAVAGALLNELARRALAGELAPGPVAGLIEGGCPPFLIEAEARHVESGGWFAALRAMTRRLAKPLPAVWQLVWPDRDGRYPWSGAASGELRAGQPLLGRIARADQAGGGISAPRATRW